MEKFEDTILDSIISGRLLSEMYYSNLNIDEALGERDDNAAFISAWEASFNQVEYEWKQSNQPAFVSEKIYQIRKSSFLQVSKATSQSEVASYVSDDLELITKAKILGLNNSFIIELWLAYESGSFPYPRHEKNA